MKLALVVLTIAVVIQASTAGVVGRSKRDIDLENVDLETQWKLLKIMVKASGQIFAKALEDIPQTPAYAEYRAELEDYVKDYNEYKTKPGNCFTKTTAMLEKFGPLTEKYSIEDAPAEIKKINELFATYGSTDMGKKTKKQLEEFEKYKNEPEATDEVVETLELLNMMLEVC